MLERGSDVGGVWRENSYPGAACDIPSHLYSFSFALEHRWSRRFAPQPDILRYLRRITDEFGLRPRLRLRTEVTEARYDDDRFPSGGEPRPPATPWRPRCWWRPAGS